MKNYAKPRTLEISIGTKNILWHSEKGVNMRVMQDDKVVVMEKRAGISTIMINNHKIANDDEDSREYFGKAPITCRDKVRQRNVVQQRPLCSKVQLLKIYQ
jgi:hypothetical protein